MDQAQRKKILARGGLSQGWQAEPMLGGWYTEEEIETAVKTIRSSLDPAVGFGFFCDEIVDFEQKFAEYIGTEVRPLGDFRRQPAWMWRCTRWTWSRAMR